MTKEEAQIKDQQYRLQIHALIAEHTKFLDENMHLVAEYPIGTPLVSVFGGAVTVTGHFRIHPGSVDDSLHCYLKFSNGDNSSRHSGFHPYLPREEINAKSDRYINKLRNCRRD